MKINCNCVQARKTALQQQGIDPEKMEDVLSHYADKEGALITILQQAQDIY